MKTKEEVLRILQQEKPELARLYGVKRLALFGSYARGHQREDSDVDILVEVDPSIGLGFVELAERIEGALGIRAEVVSRRAIKRGFGRCNVGVLLSWSKIFGRRLKRSNAMFLVWITMRLWEMRRPLTQSCEISKSSEKPPAACRKISGCSSQKSNGLKLLDSDIASSTIISISTLRSSGRLSRPIWQFSNPEFRQPANLEKKN